MNNLSLTILAFVYLFCLSIVDSLFNRLIFGSDRALPYSHPKKATIYAKWEWGFIGIFFILMTGLLLPMALSFVLGGIRMVGWYLIIFGIFQWDIVFGKLVFDNWWGDQPSIFLPKIGRLWFPLSTWILIKFVVFVGMGLLLIYLGK